MGHCRLSKKLQLNLIEFFVAESNRKDANRFAWSLVQYSPTILSQNQTCDRMQS